MTTLTPHDLHLHADVRTHALILSGIQTMNFPVTYNLYYNSMM